MAPKQLLDKEAWQWAAQTDPENVTQEHVDTAYRVKLKACQRESCRRNCKGNPHCLVGLGEKDWLGEIAEECWHNIEDPESERRQKDSFVGLKNLGATCYVNSLLQLWYHNPVFRKAIYQWKPEDDAQELLSIRSTKEEGDTKQLDCSNSRGKATVLFSDSAKVAYFSRNRRGILGTFHHTIRDDDYEPVSCVGHLQLIFARLQYSTRRYIDPSDFVLSLGLKTEEQQDAQEFSKLFMNLLENTMQCQKNALVRTIVQEQFQGEYEYVTSCKNCSRESTRTSKFYELDLNIRGHNDLSDCIEEFFKEENLEGANQYSCSHCDSKQNATRRIKLLQLPPVLNFQLLRFVFDRTTGHKKKLNNSIGFPEVLDMGKYFGAPENTQLYDVSAVLVHRGSSAYSGHYIAHIKDRTSGNWFKFNDESIEKMAGKNLTLGTEEDIEKETGKAPNKRAKVGKGHHTSQNAYMLVYMKRCDEREAIPVDSSTEWDIPEYLQTCVMRDNSKFEQWCDEIATMREENVMTGKAKQLEIRNLYHMLPAEEDVPYEWISTEWLTNWLRDDASPQVVDNGKMLCPHDRLHPDAVPRVKCVSVDAANVIYTKYQGGPRLTQESLCRECVVRRCHGLRKQSLLRENKKFINNQMKLKISDNDAAYWIGKSSLRSWTSLVMKNHDSDEQSESMLENGDQHPEDGTSGSKGVDSVDEHGDESGAGDSDATTYLGFNEDIVCVHNRLSIDENVRRLVQAQVWHRLKVYFPSAPEFSRCTESCRQCQSTEEEEVLTREMYRKMAVQQKSDLGDLYLDKNRPLAKRTCGQTLYAVSSTFIEEWRKFAKEPGRREPVSLVNNAQLLCPHLGLMYVPADASDVDNSNRLTLLWPSEWQAICRNFTVDHEITVVCRCRDGLLAAAAAATTTDDDVPMAVTGYASDSTPATPSASGAAVPVDGSGVKEELSPATTVNSPTSQQPVSSVRGPSHPAYHCKPPVCEECYTSRLHEQRMQLLDYTDAKIFVRRVSSLTSAATANAESTLNDGYSDAEDDPEFHQAGIPKKRKRLNGTGDSQPNELSQLVGLSSVRRSTRHRRTRGEKHFNVKSTQTLRELKVKIMNEFKVAPFDQHLTLNGRELNPPDATLASLNVVPESLILLKADEPGDVPTLLEEDYIKVAAPEEGFKGTELLRGFSVGNQSPPRTKAT